MTWPLSGCPLSSWLNPPSTPSCATELTSSRNNQKTLSSDKKATFLLLMMTACGGGPCWMYTGVVPQLAPEHTSSSKGAWAYSPLPAARVPLKPVTTTSAHPAEHMRYCSAACTRLLYTAGQPELLAR